MLENLEKRVESFESKIKHYLLEFTKQYSKAIEKKRLEDRVSPRITFSEEWINQVYSQYKSLKDRYLSCFNPQVVIEVKLDEHKVIAIIMTSILKVEIDRSKIQGNHSMLIDSHFAIYVMVRFFQVYYEELSKNSASYRKIKKILFPQSMNGDKYINQLAKSLYYSKEKDKEFNVLLLANTLFFIDLYNHSCYDITPTKNNH